MLQGWTLPAELNKLAPYLSSWEKRPSWENTYYTVTILLEQSCGALRREYTSFITLILITCQRVCACCDNSLPT